MYEISDAGIFACSAISTITLFILFCHVSYVKSQGGDQRQVLALTTLAYFFLWFIAILIGHSMFNLNLTPKLSVIAIFSILFPYFGNIIFYVFFKHPPVNVFGLARKIIKSEK